MERPDQCLDRVRGLCVALSLSTYLGIILTQEPLPKGAPHAIQFNTTSRSFPQLSQPTRR